MRTEFKIFLTTFSLAFDALFIIHLVAFPFYWTNASSQQGRPIDLYLPSVWTPAIIFYSVLIAVIAVVTFSLLSWLKKGKPGEANVETVIFITAFFLGFVVFWVLFASAALLRGRTMHLYYYWAPYSKTGYANFLGTFLFSFVGAVSSVAVFELNKLVRWARKRKLKAETYRPTTSKSPRKTPKTSRLLIAAVVVLIVINAGLVYSNWPTFRHSYSETFNVPGPGSITRSIELMKGNTVNGTITVSGEQLLGVQLHVFDPNQNRVFSIPYVHSPDKFIFTASSDGVYRMYFLNRNVETLSVTLEYTLY